MGFLHRHEREEHGHATPLYYFHTDAMGTPKLATNEKQQVVWRWNEDAFGATVAAEQDRHGHSEHDRDHGSHDIEVNLRYPGQYYDSETGLFYNWNRYYNPNTGRYSRSDPLGLVAGANTYAYVRGDPVNKFDPNGQRSLPSGYVTFGAGGMGNIGPFTRGADSGFAADSKGTICFYTNNCSGGGWNTPLGGSIGLVGSIGSGSLCSGTTNTKGGYAGPHQVQGNQDGASYGRGIYGPTAGTGAGYLQCETRYYCLGN